jgi:hypothetical protein
MSTETNRAIGNFVRTAPEVCPEGTPKNRMIGYVTPIGTGDASPGKGISLTKSGKIVVTPTAPFPAGTDALEYGKAHLAAPEQAGFTEADHEDAANEHKTASGFQLHLGNVELAAAHAACATAHAATAERLAGKRTVDSATGAQDAGAGLETIIASGADSPMSARDRFAERLCSGDMSGPSAPVLDIADGPVVVHGTKYVGRDAMIEKLNHPAAPAAPAAPLPGGRQGMLDRINSGK